MNLNCGVKCALYKDLSAKCRLLTMTENPLLLKMVSLIIRSPSSIHCYLESTNVEECHDTIGQKS